MGWNRVAQTCDHPLWHEIPNNSWFYFVHSYFVQAQEATQVAGTASYPNPFAAVLLREGVFATQFHPEKSQEMGLQLLANFMTWDGSL